jgi:chromosome segregation protein
MRVERLELLGFKSFSEKTVFHLHPGITCIVGPNGCGKSNIVDAFKWVLGEQSAKSLRGDKMEQVIFTGSQSRKPRGMAEVKLIVSGLAGNPGNGNGDAPVTVGRRLYRSGESDYLVNRNVCRLRDIRDIFLDTGLEVKSYSILEQDRISAILSAKPDERRFLLEEVAGVVKYKVRRNEALSKLESSRNNLQRIGDIIAEIRRQINSLDRQVKRAERYKRLTAELRAVELRLARRDYAELTEALERIISEHGALREREASKRAELGRIEADIESRRIAMAERERGMNTLLGELQGVQRGIAERERSIAVARAERDSLRENLGRLRQEEKEAAEKAASAGERQGEIASLLEGLEGEVLALRGRMEEKERSLFESEGEITSVESLLEEKRREAFRVSDELGGIRNAHGRHQDAQEALGRRLERLSGEASELASSLEEARGTLKGIERDTEEKGAEAVALAERKKSLEGEAERLRDGLEELVRETSREREDLASASSRLGSLRELVVSDGVAAGLSGEVDIVASVSDIVEVPQEYEKAIENALREAASGIVLRGRDEVLRAVAAAKDKDLGRTAFISASGGGPLSGSQLPDGAMARASDMVGINGEYRGLIERLLGNVFVVRDIETALGMEAGGATLVTLEGETVEPSGAVVAGKARGILALKRQIRELEEETEGRRATVSSLEARTEEARASIRENEEARQEASRRHVEVERELSLLRLRAEKQAEEIERGQRKLEVVRMEEEQASGERRQLEALIGEKASAIAALEEEKARTERAIAEIQGEISSRRAGHEQKRAESVDLRLELSSIGERMNSLRNEAASVRGLMEELARKGEALRGEMAGVEERIRQGEEEARAREDELRGEVVKAAELEGRISAEREAASSEAEEVRSAEQGLRALRSEIEGMTQGLSELEVRKAEHRLRLENLVERIRGAYSAELAEVEEEPLEEGDPERRAELKDKIEKLGPVSLGSIEEYEELKERYDFLHKQQQDLELSIAELEEAISRINSTTRKKLREAYEALRGKFAEVFVTLFGGGKAELVLTDERNILETGIDIVAQPPGKKLQNITLLSGGEKSLTALALLFASFLIKPTPICILDEADAALDESNTFKFSEMIKELSREIQFVVVTHNRLTMEASDFIYGITMEEPGVSKAISMQLAES